MTTIREEALAACELMGGLRSDSKEVSSRDRDFWLSGCAWALERAAKRVCARCEMNAERVIGGDGLSWHSDPRFAYSSRRCDACELHRMSAALRSAQEAKP